MDEFIPYSDSFKEALKNLEKVLEICKKTHVSLGRVKCHMMMKEGIVLVLGCLIFFPRLAPLVKPGGLSGHRASPLLC